MTEYKYQFTVIIPVYNVEQYLAETLDFCLLDRGGRVPFAMSFPAMIPMLLYGAGYSLNLLINGIGAWPHTNDWYGFARGGMASAAMVFVIILAGTWCLALLLRLPRRK